MSYSRLDDIAAEKIGFYVYALRDPRNATIFYIGKGSGNRWHDHVLEARSKRGESSLKLDRIREIEAAGFEVEAFIIRSGISQEKVAFEVEAAVIHAFKLLKKANDSAEVDLTNVAEVHQPERGLVDVRIAQSLFNAPQCPPITAPVALFRIPRLWYPEMSDQELREATFGWWPERSVKKGMTSARYAFAVSRLIIRGVYRIDSTMWRPRVEGDRDWANDVGRTPRWGFPDCQPAPEMSPFLNTSVRHIFKKGDQNSVRFLNC